MVPARVCDRMTRKHVDRGLGQDPPGLLEVSPRRWPPASLGSVTGLCSEQVCWATFNEGTQGGLGAKGPSRFLPAHHALVHRKLDQVPVSGVPDPWAPGGGWPAGCWEPGHAAGPLPTAGLPA